MGGNENEHEGRDMASKKGSEIQVGDVIFVGIGKRTGRVQSFKDHPQFAELNPGYSARVAVTDRGSITVVDQDIIRIGGV